MTAAAVSIAGGRGWQPNGVDAGDRERSDEWPPGDGDCSGGRCCCCVAVAGCC